MAKTEFTIRPMTIDDLVDVMLIDSSVYSDSWSREVFVQELTDNPYAYYAVMTVAGKIAGYAGAWIVKDDAQITNIVIHEAYRGDNLGKALFEHMLQVIVHQGATRLSLEVRKSNYVAQHMYRQFGLVKGGVRKNYYKDNLEDAVVMWVKLK